MVRVALRAAAEAFGIVVQALPFTLRWSSYEMTPDPLSAAASQSIERVIPGPIALLIGRLTRGGAATGAVESSRTVIAAVPLTPLAVATTCPVPGAVATHRPAAWMG